MTHEDLKILNQVSARICGYGLAASGDRSDFRTRVIRTDGIDAHVMAHYDRHLEGGVSDDE
jgi:hypothetical protein